MDGIEAELNKQKLKLIRIDGSTSMNKRHDLVQQFQENNQIRIALLGISATGLGLTLTAASTILFAEMHWTPAIMLQAEDRAHRIGQVNSVNCHYLYGSGTLDDKLYAKLEYKLGIVSEMIDGSRKDLEVESYLEKGNLGAISFDKNLAEKPKVKSIFHNERDNSEGKTEKITSFFEVIGVKSSMATTNSEEKKKNFEEKNKKNSVEKCFNTLSSIPKENHSECSDLPDLELLDQIVDEINRSEKKANPKALENKENDKNCKIAEKNINIPAKKNNHLTIEQMREVFKKEFKNNLVEGEAQEFIIESNENSKVKIINEGSSHTVILEDLRSKIEKKPLENIGNIKSDEIESGKDEQIKKQKRSEVRENDLKVEKKTQKFKDI